MVNNIGIGKTAEVASLLKRGGFSFSGAMHFEATGIFMTMRNNISRLRSITELGWPARAS